MTRNYIPQVAVHPPFETTGRTRYRVMTVRRFFSSRTYLVLQVEAKGFTMSFSSGFSEHKPLTWWVDCKPEWILTNDAPTPPTDT